MMLAGVLTASELALLRTRPQRTELYLATPDYRTIYTAQVNAVPPSNDSVVTVDFYNGVGTLTDVEPGMTLFVGSTPGAWDIGIARIRYDSLDLGGGFGNFYIGITSDIDWTFDYYLTVVNDFSLWPRHPYVAVTGTYMDYLIGYTNQNQAGPPVPIMGTHAVLELTGASVSVTFDASDSYSCIGTPTTYDFAWYVDGVLVSNADAVTLAFTAIGTYLIKLEVTANYSFCVAGPESVAYRYVIVHDCEHPLNSSFVLDSCSGSFSGGGWSYSVTMNANAGQAYIRDRTLCLLVARDWYDDTEQSIGPLDERENIICIGWVDGESVRRSNDKSMVSFDVQGPNFWLGVQEGFPTGIDDTNVVPTDWEHIQALDPCKGLFSFLHWRTTSTMVMDCYITSDDHRLATTYTPAGSLFEQLRAIIERVNGYTVCDRYGRLFCEIDTQFIDPALRVPPTFPVVQTFTDRDWRDEISIERRTVNTTGQVDLSGIYYSGDLTTSQAIFSLSPGHIPRHYGEKRSIERIALDNQAEANLLAGLWLGYLNNEYPNVDVPLSSNHRGFDIAPRMFAQMSMASGDTPREIEWTNKKLIPREVSFNYDTRQAVLLTDITFEAEAFPSEAVTGDPPLEPPDPIEIPTPVPPTACNDPLAINYGMIGECIYPPAVDIVVVMTKAYLAYSLNAISDPANANWTNITPVGMPASSMMDILVNGSELWLAVKSVVNDAWEGIWYTADLTIDPLTRILSTAQARVDLGGGVAANQYFNLHSLCMLGTECLVTCESCMWDTVTFHYWHGNAAMAHDTCGPLVAVVTSTNGTSCTDGITARYGMNAGGRNSWVMDVVPCTQIFQAPPYPIGGNLQIASENYAINDNGNIYIPINAMAWAVAYAGASSSYQALEFGGSLFWMRAADYALMQNGSAYALTNDAGGVDGVFSAAGATGGGWSTIQAGIMVWVSNSIDAVNSKRNMAVTTDGGATWASIDGDWNAAVAVYDGAAISIPCVVKCASA